MINNQIRTSLYLQANNFLEQIKNKKSLLVNLFGIDGMGKSSFIEKVMPKMLDKNNLRYKILSVSSQNDVSKLAIDLLGWGYDNLLKSTEKIKLKELRNNLNNIESSFSRFSVEIHNQKHWYPFVVLIDGLDNLSIDNLDWFQATCVEVFSLLPNSMIIITSHNELSWHSWELRNLCVRIPLAGFKYEEIDSICSSSILAQRVFQLSGGHPATVEALLRVAEEQHHDLNSIVDLENLNKFLFQELKAQVDKNLLVRIKYKWLREMFWLAAAADRFDAELLSDIAKDRGIKIPDDVTDIAWEMAYTGLAVWDLESQTYMMVPELRDRINQYNLNVEKKQYINTLSAIAKSYRLRMSHPLNATKINRTIAKDYLARVQALTLDSEAGHYSKKKAQSKITKSKIVGGGKMKTGNQAGTQKIYVSRKRAEEKFRNLINGQLKNKWIFGIQGDPGIGKSYLVKRYQEIAEAEQRPVIVLDLNFVKNRQREIILREIVSRFHLKSSYVRKAMMPILRSNPGDKVVYMGIESTETFDYYTTKAVTAIAQELVGATKNKERPIVILDTFDDNPGTNQLAAWFFGDVLHEFRDSIYLIVAGRRSLLDVVKKDVVDEVEFFNLDNLAEKDIRDIANRWKKIWGGPINDGLISSVEKIAGGNPLIASWVLFYIKEFANPEDLTWLVDVADKNRALKKIANFILGKNRSTPSEYSTFKALQAAIHFGAYFNLDLFKAAVPNKELGGKSHKEVFDNIAGYFYVRQAVNNWTLHDQIRDWMRAASKLDQNIPDFIDLSNNAIQNYFDPQIKKITSKKNKSIEEQAVLDNLYAQRLSNILYIQSAPHARAADYHLKLWDHLDSLWHRYRLEQMAQVIQYGRDVQEWKPSSHDDTLLTNILDATQAWAYFSQTDYSKAKFYAEKVVTDKTAPRRLIATAKVILGLLPTQNPEKAIETYLDPAKQTYQQILEELIDDKLPDGEFVDRRRDIYLEIHQVLKSIGGMHLHHFYDLEKGKTALEEAHNLAKYKLNLPLYAATALNEWARILRFEGDFDDALNKVTLAITTYKVGMKNPEVDVNFGYFYETLGLIYKEKDDFLLAKEHLNKALQVYNNIQGPMELRKATIYLELGTVHMLMGELNVAENLLLRANGTFKQQIEKTPWYYLNSVEKLGEYYVEKKDYYQARACFEEQKILAGKFGHDLWEYWAIQHLASLDFKQNRKVDTRKLEKVLFEYDKKRNRQFNPAFWRTKLLLYKVAKKKGDQSLSIKQLAEGLAYLAEKWKPLFLHNLGLLHSELLDLEYNELVNQVNRLKKLWRSKFPQKDPMPSFLRMLDDLIIKM